MFLNSPPRARDFRARVIPFTMRSFSFLIAINARKVNRNEKKESQIREDFLYFFFAFLFSCTEILSMSYRRGFLVYLREAGGVNLFICAKRIQFQTKGVRLVGASIYATFKRKETKN